MRDDIIFIIWPQIPKCYGPIFFRNKGDIESNPVANGSYTLIDTGEKKILVTNAHVLDGFDKEKQKSPSLEMHVGLHGGGVFILLPHLLDYDRGLDLVTFDFTGFNMPGNNYEFCKLPTNAPNLALNASVFAVGYPGCYRRAKIGEVYSGAQPMALNITRISADRSFSCDIKKARFEAREMEKDPHNMLAGCSGGPCFLVKKIGQKPIVVGITKESRPMPFINEHSIEFANIRRIQTNGTLNKS